MTEPADVPTFWKNLAVTAAVAGAVVSLGRPPVSAHPQIATTLTWRRDIQPILARRCLGCHVPGGPAPMALDRYPVARPWAASIRQEIMERRMPPTGVRLGANRFSNVPSLSMAEMEMLIAWIDGGAPRGTPDDEPPAPPAPTLPAFAARASARRTTGGPVTIEAPTALLGMKLVLQAPDAIADVVAVHPGGRRDFLMRMGPPGTPDQTTYWLRRPLAMARGTRIEVRTPAPFSLDLMVGQAPSGPSPRR